MQISCIWEQSPKSHILITNHLQITMADFVILRLKTLDRYCWTLKEIYRSAKMLEIFKVITVYKVSRSKWESKSMILFLWDMLISTLKTKKRTD
jgi:hypothetical protein